MYSEEKMRDLQVGDRYEIVFKGDGRTTVADVMISAIETAYVLVEYLDPETAEPYSEPKRGWIPRGLFTKRRVYVERMCL